MNHKNNCSCEICSNAKEERQFALWKPLDDKDGILIDCEELSHIFEYFDDKTLIEKIEKKTVSEEKEPVLAYGVAIPCEYGSDSLERMEMDLIKFKNYAHSTLDNMTEYISVYEDIKVYSDSVVYKNHIPVACLLYSDIDVAKKRDFDFGYTFYLKFHNEGMNIFNNIINRKYIICLKGIEDTFDYADKANWEKYVDKDRSIRVAKEII